MARLILSFVFLFVALISVCQDRPKVGLVLSGGGAKGIAHIGVIKVLEEVGIVPDYITGTSMGAIVGGLYAIGYSPQQLEEIALTSDWDQLLGNKISLRNISIEHKDYYGQYQLVVPVDGFNVSLPQGVIEGQELSSLLLKLTAPVHDIYDFDSLPRPFRCIGAEISTGDKVVLKEGFLATALRASMAIPSVFTPVEIDGRVLVDGGLVHNFPVEEVIEMGADIVIGVSVSDSLRESEDLNSLIDILTQATFITSVKSTNEQKKLVDYFIQPSTRPYTAGSFADADSICMRGEVCARGMIAELQALADSLKELRTFQPIVMPPIDDEWVFSEITTRGNQSIPDDRILGKFNINPGDTITQKGLKEGIDAVYGTLNFDRVAYEIRPDTNAHHAVILDIDESQPGRLSFGLHYDTENGVGLLTTFQYRNFGLKNSRFTFEADIAETPYLNAEYFWYLGRDQRRAVALGARIFWDEVPIFSLAGNVESVYNTILRQYYLNFQSTFNKDWSYGIRFFSEVNTWRPKIVGDDMRLFDKLRYANFGIRPYFILNTLDRRAIPRRGSLFNAAFTANLAMEAELEEPTFDDSNVDPEYTLVSLNGDYTHYSPIGEKFNVMFRLEMRLTNMEVGRLNLSDYYFLGGFRPNFINATEFWGDDKYQFELTSFFRSSVVLRYNPIRNLYFTIGANYLETEYPMEWINGSGFFENVAAGGLDRRLGFVFGVIFNSIAGPLKFVVAKDVDNSTWKPWLSVGYNFRNSPRP